MENLENLEFQLNENRKKNLEIQNKIDELKIKEVLPKIKEQYEGKYWKYRNSCGNEKWWLYSFCIEAENERGGLFNSFETTPYESKFNVATNRYFHLCQEEITRGEYIEALQEFKDKLGALAN